MWPIPIGHPWYIQIRQHPHISYLLLTKNSSTLPFSSILGRNFSAESCTSHSFLMAPALSSNSFLGTALCSKLELKLSKPAFTIQAKTKNVESQEEGSSKPKFSIDFSKLSADAKSLIPVVNSPATSLFASPRRKDPNTVFVAGATGQAGIRIAQTLLRQGFNVRAGVPELESAQELARLASTYMLISSAESKRLNAVQTTFTTPEQIAKAIGPAAKLCITIGPTENGPTSPITTENAFQLILAAQLAGVSHVTIIYDSTNSDSFSPSNQSSTYNVLDGLNSLFSNISSLFVKDGSLSIGGLLDKIVESTEVKYTVIKAAIDEDYSEVSGFGIVVEKEGVVSETKVAKAQIAKLVADIFSDTTVTENKVVEVSTSPSATSKSVTELFSAIPEDGRRKAYAEAIAKAKAEEEAQITSEKANKAAKAAKKLEAEVKELSEKQVKASTLAKEAKTKAETASSTLDSILTKAKGFSAEGNFSWDKLRVQIANAIPQTQEDSKTEISTVRGQAKARSLLPQKAIVKPAAAFKLKTKSKAPEIKPKVKETEPEKEVRKIFGGLFKQETIYMDD